MGPDILYSGQPAQASQEQSQSAFEQERQIARLRTLQQISRKLNSKLELEDALVNILDEAIQAVGAERGCLLMVNKATDELEVRLCRRLQLSEFDGKPFRFSRTVIERVYREGEAVLTANAAEDPELTKADSVIRSSLRSILCVPLHSQGEMIGVLYLDNRLKVGQFQEDDLALVNAIGDQAAIALRNAQLHQEVVNRAQRQMQVLQHIQSLNQISLRVQGLTDFCDLYAVIGEELEQFGYHCAIALLSSDKTHLETHYVSSDGITIPDTSGCPEGVPVVALDETVICRQVLETRSGWFASSLDDVMVELLGHPTDLADKSAFVAPLVAGNQALGLLTLGLGSPHLEDSSLLLAFANQIATIIETFRLYGEARRRLEEQTTLRAEMQSVLAIARAMVSEIGLDNLLAFIMAQAGHLTNAQGAAVLLLSDDGQSLEVAPSSASWLHMEAGSSLSIEGSLAGLVIGDQQVHVNNQAQDDDRTISIRALLQPIELHSILCAPLVVQGKSLGVLLMWNKQDGAFTTHDNRLMGLFADQAALALHNAQLYQAAQQELVERKRAEQALLGHYRELELLNQATQAFNSTLHLNQVLATVLEGIRQLLSVIACQIWLIDPETDELVCRQAAGSGSEIVRGRRLALGEGLVGKVASSGESQVVADIQGEECFFEEIARETGVEIRSVLCVPLRAKRGVIGVIHLVDAHVNHFGSTDVGWVEALAAAAASAIENAQLHTQIRQLAAEQERQKLARDLHDTVTQSLYSIGMAAQTSLKLARQDHLDTGALAAIKHILALSQTTLSEMREFLYDLHPTALADRGLIGSLVQHFDVLRTKYLVSIDFRADSEPLVPMIHKEALFHIAREALWNVVKYASATHVDVLLGVEGNQVTLSVVDDGAGFDPSVYIEEETIGLRNMKQRAELVGGVLELDTTPGHGTRITARIPLQTSDPTGKIHS